MKIFLVGNELNRKIPTGPARVAENLFYGFKKKGESVSFYELNRHKNIANTKSDGNLNSYKSKGFIKTAIDIITLKPHIVLIASWNSRNTLILIFKFILKSKFVYICHGLILMELARHPKTFRNYLYKLLEKINFRLADAIVSVSPLHDKLIKKHFAYIKSKVFLIPNGVSGDFFHTREKEFLIPLELLIHFEAVKMEKSEIEYIFNITKHLRKQGKLKISIISNSGLQNLDENQEQIFYFDKLPIIDFLGMLQSRHIYINVNRYESFSLTALECAASGLIVILKDTVGMSSYIVDAENGFVIKNLVDIQSVLEKIVKGEFDLKSISHNSTCLAKKFAWDGVVDNYLKLFWTI